MDEKKYFHIDCPGVLREYRVSNKLFSYSNPQNQVFSTHAEAEKYLVNEIENIINYYYERDQDVAFYFLRDDILDCGCSNCALVRSLLIVNEPLTYENLFALFSKYIIVHSEPRPG